MAAKKRITQSNQDQSSIDAMTFNAFSGGQKNLEVGRYHLPIPVGTAFTTDASTAISLPSRGINIAVYNNASAVGSITLGTDNTIAALAPGATDASGNVGVPCPPGQWSFLACYDKQWVRTTASTLLVFVVADDTTIQ